MTISNSPATTFAIGPLVNPAVLVDIIKHPRALTKPRVKKRSAGGNAIQIPCRPIVIITLGEKPMPPTTVIHTGTNLRREPNHDWIAIGSNQWQAIGFRFLPGPEPCYLDILKDKALQAV